jgi:hypothetical protein
MARVAEYMFCEARKSKNRRNWYWGLNGTTQKKIVVKYNNLELPINKKLNIINLRPWRLKTPEKEPSILRLCSSSEVIYCFLLSAVHWLLHPRGPLTFIMFAE